jgi:tetratricopeptide (TPR) repeat protein
MKSCYSTHVSPVLAAALGLALCGTVLSARVSAQAPAEKPKTGQQANPFPEDTNTVPVLPSANSPAAPPPSANDSVNVSLPGDENDPVRSPDEVQPSTGDSSSSSSSSAGLDNLLKPPPDTGKNGQPKEEHHEGAKEDESVGSYYLDQKNWKAALSRFESALVLDPEDPEVYWGLAESQRHMGNYADAKKNYLKVMEYDPDSKHSKEAKKILKGPEMENAKAASANAPAAPSRP